MSNYTDFVDPLLRSFRQEILKYFGNIEHELKSDSTVVTKLDKSIESRIRESLQKEYPEIGFNGEELGRSGNQDKFWLIDPIDGTQNFIRGINGVGMILGLVDIAEVVFTAIYNPIEDLLFIAEKGKGVTCNRESVSVSDRLIGNSLIEIASKFTDDVFIEIMQLLKKYKAKDLRIHGSADRAMLVSEGKIEGTIRLLAGGSDWDYAPGNMLMREAGAKIIYFDGKNELESRSFAVLSPNCYSALVDDLTKIITNSSKFESRE